MHKRMYTVGSSVRRSRSILGRRLRTFMKRSRSLRGNNPWLLLLDTIKMMRRIFRQIQARSINILKEIEKRVDSISLSILNKRSIFSRDFVKKSLVQSTCNLKNQNHKTPVPTSTFTYIQKSKCFQKDGKFDRAQGRFKWREGRQQCSKEEVNLTYCDFNR